MRTSLRVLDLLFATYPLIRLVRGEKRRALQRVWIAAVDCEGAQILALDETQLPATPRAAAEQNLRIALQLCHQYGMNFIDMSDFLAARADDSDFIVDFDGDEGIARAQAALAMVAARRLHARDPIPAADEQVSA